MGNKVSFIIQLQNKFSKQADKIRNATKGMTGGFAKLDRKVKSASVKLSGLGRKVKNVGGKFSQFGRKLTNAAKLPLVTFKKLGRVVERASKKLEVFGKKAKAVGSRLKDLGKSLTTRVTLPLVAFGTVALIQSAKLETLATSFETMTGSAKKGKDLLAKLVRFTATTPFQLAGVGKATKTLLAFKVPLKAMLPTLRMLGDIAAGTEAPLSDIAQIFGKARAKGKLMTEELLQLAERGIPIIDLLATKFNLSKAAIFKLASESKISFKVMENALRDMTSKGGIFFDQTKRQSATLAGLFSTLKDNIVLTSGVIGDIIVEVFGLKDGLSGLSDFFNELRTNIRAFAKEHPAITKLIAVIVGLIAILAPVLIMVGQMVIAFGALTLASSVLGLSFTAIIVPILLVVAAVGLLITAGVLIVKNWEEIKGGARELWRTVSGAVENMVKSFGGLKFSIVAVGVAIAAMFSPILAVIAAIALVGTAGVLIVNNWDDIKEGARLLWRDISGFFSNLWGDITGGAEILVESMSGFFSNILSSASGFGSDLIDSLMSPINFVTNKLSGVKDKISSLFSFGPNNKAIIEIEAVSKKIPVINPVIKFNTDFTNVDFSLMDSLSNKISDAGRNTASRFPLNETEIKVTQDMMQKSQTDINVNLRAPAGIIESVKSKTTGNRSGLNMGVNMQEAG